MINKIYKLFNLNPDSKLAQYLLKGTSASFVIHIAFVFVAFVTSLILPNLCGVDEYGKYVYAINWLSIFAIIGCFGLNSYLLREIAKLKIDNDLNSLKSIIYQVNLRGFFIAIFVASTSYFLINQLEIFKEQYISSIKIGLLVLPFWVLLLFNASALRGAKHIITSQIPDKIVRPILFLILLFAFYFFNNKSINADYIILSQVIVITVAFVFAVIFLFRKEKYLLDKKVEPNKNFKLGWSVSLGFWAIAIVYIVNNKIDLLLIGTLLEPKDVGVYNIAIRLSDFIKMFLIIVNMVIAPEIASLFKQDKTEKLQLLLKKSIRITFVASFVIAIFIALAGKYLLPFYGAEFIAGYVPLLIMCVVQLINVGLGSVGNVLAMTNNENYSLICLIVSLVANVFFNYLLIPIYGIIGAAIATGISIFIWNFLMWLIIRKKLKINTSIF